MPLSRLHLCPLFQDLKPSATVMHAPTFEKEEIRCFLSRESFLCLHVRFKGSAHTAPLRGPLGLSFWKTPKQRIFHILYSFEYIVFGHIL